MNPAVNAGAAPVATTFFFYFLAGAAVLSGLFVITRRNAVHSALALIVTLLSVAGLYLMLYAPFVAGVQIIVYAGGIMVLFLFVIMLVNIERVSKERQFNRIWPIGIVCVLLAADCVHRFRLSPQSMKGKSRFRIAWCSCPRRPIRKRSPPHFTEKRAAWANIRSPSRSRRCCCWSRSWGR